jgi:hypothetical protein
MIKYETFHIDSYTCNALDTTLHACGTGLDVGVMLPIDPPSTLSIKTFHQHWTWPCMYEHMTRHSIYSYTTTQIINTHQQSSTLYTYICSSSIFNIITFHLHFIYVYSTSKSSSPINGLQRYILHQINQITWFGTITLFKTINHVW